MIYFHFYFYVLHGNKLEIYSTWQMIKILFIQIRDPQHNGKQIKRNYNPYYI